MKIGIFDSGIGGTTVLKELQKLLPDEQYIYYSDSANNPYGNKSHAEIEELSLKAIKFFNGARGLARNLAESIKDKKSPKGEGNVEFYDTGRGYQVRTGDSPLGRYASSQADTVDWNN